MTTNRGGLITCPWCGEVYVPHPGDEGRADWMCDCVVFEPADPESAD